MSQEFHEDHNGSIFCWVYGSDLINTVSLEGSSELVFVAYDFSCSF